LQQIDAMYSHFVIAMSDTGRRAMAQYLVDHPRDARPPHRFSLGSDAVIAHAREVFKRYQNYFGVANE
jgi:hypothetical protein